MATLQSRIDTLLAKQCSDGRERGIQVVAYHRGELIVDTCAGIADVRTGVPVTRETLFPVFSVTKGFLATVIHQLVEQGLLSYDTRIAEVWPEFGAHGKTAITLEHVLRHRAGLPCLPPQITPEDTADWDGICRTIANLTPEWPAGSNCIYHALTYGWLLGEVARRVTGQGFSRLLKERITTPLGLETLFVGIPKDVSPTVGWVEESAFEMPPDDGTPQAVPRSMLPLATWMNNPAAHRACVPAGNGIMNAQAMARHYAALLPGGLNGVELLPPSRVEAATALIPLPTTADEEAPNHFALGYAVGLLEAERDDTTRAFGHGGYGGSTAFADRERQLAVGITRNLLQPDAPAREVIDLICESIS